MYRALATLFVLVSLACASTPAQAAPRGRGPGGFFSLGQRGPALGLSGMSGTSRGPGIDQRLFHLIG
jgi:hypothetical protein